MSTDLRNPITLEDGQLAGNPTATDRYQDVFE